MRNQFTILIFLFLTCNLFGQFKPDTTYFNSKWEPSSIDDYQYYRTITLEKDGLYSCKDFWKSGELQMKGKLGSIKPQSREGEFQWFNLNGTIKQKIIYRNNEIIGQVEKYDSLGNLDFKYVVSLDSLDNSREFYNSINNFVLFISENLNYPQKSKKAGIQGKVITSFYIDNTGKVSRLIIKNSVNSEIDNEAKRVIMKYKRWPIPKYNGENTSIEFEFPINFKFRDN